MNNEEYKRSAGILMAITSLPGSPYTGDIGYPAREFANFLYKSNQVVWQLLPVQSVTAGQGYSPYSSTSSMAGNIALISAELLTEAGWITEKDILKKNKNPPVKADFKKALEYKNSLLEKGWKKWSAAATEKEKEKFKTYCQQEEYWLKDYALYCVIKKQYDDAAWYQWPEKLKHKDKEALSKCEEENEEEILKIKWGQMIFDDQWLKLKKFCTSLGISLLGDIPIYVAHDSADVWSHREIFTINSEGDLLEVAGVPPDLFNDEGQLWGMPLFRWDVLKEKNYDWWAKRISKNLLWFDSVRLDHFRAFASYWAVPADATTAKEGEWRKGPGTDFFEAMRKSLGNIPFVAEDLGEIDEDVYILRDELELPGMNVLHFAFGADDMQQSPYLPHLHIRNSLVYTGTHDNNTTVGWFKTMVAGDRKNLEAYAGVVISEKNVSAQLCRLAYGSVAKLVILPIQDVLGLDETARMNMPASAGENWTWRLKSGQLTEKIIGKLNDWCFYFGRMRDPIPPKKKKTIA